MPRKAKQKPLPRNLLSMSQAAFDKLMKEIPDAAIDYIQHAEGLDYGCEGWGEKPIGFADMPACCGILVAGDFATIQGPVVLRKRVENLYDPGPRTGDIEHRYTERDLILISAQKIRERARHFNTVIATTIPTQTFANKLLRRLSFKPLELGKSGHGNYNITLWTWVRARAEVK